MGDALIALVSTCQRVYRVQSPSECLVKDVTDPGSSAQLAGLDVPGGAVQGGHVRGGELGDDLIRTSRHYISYTVLKTILKLHLQQRRVLVHDSGPVGVEQCLELRGQNIDSGLELWQTVPGAAHRYHYITIVIIIAINVIITLCGASAAC